MRFLFSRSKSLLKKLFLDKLLTQRPILNPTINLIFTMTVKPSIRKIIIRTINVSTDFLKAMSLIERDKFQLAKKLRENSNRSLDSSFLQKIFLKTYYIYKFPYKIKFLVGKFVDKLERNKKELNFFFSTIIVVCMLMIPIAIFLVLIWVINYWNYIDEFLKLIKTVKEKNINHDNPRLVKIEEWLGRIVSKHVLYSETIILKTDKLVNEVFAKPNVDAHIRKSLRNLLKKDFIQKNTEKLAINFLHKNLLYEDFIYQKFNNLVIGQYKKENIQRVALKTCIDFSRTDFAKSVFITNFGYAIRNQGVVNGFVEGCRSKAFDILENEYFINLASKKLRSFADSYQ